MHNYHKIIYSTIINNRHTLVHIQFYTELLVHLQHITHTHHIVLISLCGSF